MVREQVCQWALTQEHSGVAAHHSLVICVSLRMAASAEAPSYPMPLPPRLRARGGVGVVREQACRWALTRLPNARAVAHSRYLIFVLLRMAASAVAPLAPMPLFVRLQGMGGGSERAGEC